jgi:hypothetical protein
VGAPQGGRNLTLTEARTYPGVSDLRRDGRDLCAASSSSAICRSLTSGHRAPSSQAALCHLLFGAFGTLGAPTDEGAQQWGREWHAPPLNGTPGEPNRHGTWRIQRATDARSLVGTLSVQTAGGIERAAKFGPWR